MEKNCFTVYWIVSIALLRNTFWMVWWAFIHLLRFGDLGNYTDIFLHQWQLLCQVSYEYFVLQLWCIRCFPSVLQAQPLPHHEHWYWGKHMKLKIQIWTSPTFLFSVSPWQLSYLILVNNEVISSSSQSVLGTYPWAFLKCRKWQRLTGQCRKNSIFCGQFVSYLVMADAHWTGNHSSLWKMQRTLKPLS